MKNFGDAFSNPDYIQGHTEIATGESKGFFYVESKNDVGFWQYLIENICPNKYEIKPASQIKSDGKKTLEKEYSKLNSKSLVGVDSDMDYLCPSRSQYASELSSNPYVLHTFSYSKESLECSIESIEGITVRLRFVDKIECELVDSLKSLSNVVYDALLVHLYRHNNSPANHEDGLLWKELKLSGNASIIDIKDLKTDVNTINIIQAKLSAFIVKYAITPAEKADFDNYVIDLGHKGLSQQTAYQFIKGHVLHDTYVYPALKMFRDKSYTNEIRKIGKECKSSDKEDERNARIGELNNFYKKRNVLETMMCNNLIYANCSLYKMVQAKLANIP